MAAIAGEIRRRVPLRVRLFAWWQGYDPNDIYTGDPEELQFDGEARPQPSLMAHDLRPTKVPIWSAERIGVVEKLWGQGLHTPGGREHLLTLLDPLGLNPTMTVLEIGAGLGGIARLMTNHFGCWVTGMEPWKILAEAGQERSREAGLEKKAAVEPFDATQPRLKAGAYHCIFAKEAFFTIADKPALFDAMVQSLRPGGQLCFTDYVLPETSKATEKVDAWIASEPIAPDLWNSQMVVDVLGQYGLEVRVSEDITDLHQAMILHGWRELTRELTPGAVAPDLVPYLVQEAELWARRGALLRSGEIRVYRFHALKPAAPVP